MGAFRRSGVSGFLVASIFLSASCVRNPVTGGRQLALISEAQEKAIGEASHPEILAEFGMVEDPQLQEYFSRIGLELAGISHRPQLAWKFTVLDTPVVNAFAVPGGYIYLTRGILGHMNNEAEMAGVVGHEIGHVTARHSVTQLSQQQLLGLGLGIGSILSPTFRQLGSLAETGLSVLLLKYSRDHERQSDQLGLQYMSQAGYDPSQVSRFFELFERMSEGEGERLPNWLSSHPAPPDRVKATSALAEKIKQENAGRQFKVNAEQLMERVDGIVFGDNPREGYVEQGKFLHPDLRFQLDVPQGWKVQNTKSVVTFLEPNGGAAIQLTLVPPKSGETPEAVAAAIRNQEGVQFIEGDRIQIAGANAYVGRYRVQDSQGGIVAVLAAFVPYNKNMYQIAGLTSESAFSTYARSFENTIRGFRQLSDPRILAVQPDRIRVQTAKKGDTLRSISGIQKTSRITIEELSLLNRLDPDQPLASGARVKVVRPGR